MNRILRPQARLNIQLAALILSTLLIVLVLGRGASASDGDTLLVTNGNDSGPGSLRQAFADAQNGDTILIDIPVTAADSLAEEVIISLESAVFNDKDISARIAPGKSYIAVLEMLPATNSRLLVNSSDLIMEGFYFRNGRSAAGITPGDGFGGAIYNQGALTLKDTGFTDNSAEIGAGAIFNIGVLTIDGLTAVNNGVYQEGSSDYAGYGGFAMNVAQGEGNKASLIIRGASFQGSSAGGGGLLYTYADAGASAATSLYEIHAEQNQGHTGIITTEAVDGGSAETTIDRSSFSANKTEYGGVSAASNLGARVILTNVTAYKNTANIEGNVIINSNGAETEARYVTFVDNDPAEGDGGAQESIRNFDPNILGGRVTLTGAIVRDKGLVFDGDNFTNGGSNLADDESAFKDGEESSYVMTEIPLGPFEKAGEWVYASKYSPSLDDLVVIQDGLNLCGDPVNEDAWGVMRPKEFFDDAWCTPGATQLKETEIIIRKEVPAGIQNQDPFVFTIYWGHMQKSYNFKLNGGESVVINLPESDTLKFSEQFSDEWVPYAIECTGEMGDVVANLSIEDRTSNFYIEKSEPYLKVLCTVKNTQNNSLRIVKDAPDEDTEFQFEVSGLIGRPNNQLSKTATVRFPWIIENIPPGQINVKEILAPNWALISVKCTGVGGTAIPGGVSLNFKEGESRQAVCTFENLLKFEDPSRVFFPNIMKKY